MTRGYLPSEPLVEFIEARAKMAGVGSMTYVREALGSNTERSYCRWKSGQTIRWFTADQIAIALGVHPSTIWPVAWYEAVA